MFFTRHGAYVNEVAYTEYYTTRSLYRKSESYVQPVIGGVDQTLWVAGGGGGVDIRLSTCKY